MKRRTVQFNLPGLIPVAAFLAAIVAYAYVGFSARYLADDYCIAEVVLSEGFIAAQKTWYLGWSGRFSFTFVASLFTLLGPGIVPYLPAFALILWLIGLTWTFWQGSLVVRVVRLPRSILMSLLLATLIIFATVDNIPNLTQSIYWQTGMLTYVLPLILATLFVGMAIWNVRQKDNTGPGWLLLSAIFTFVAGGFSETYVATQTTALFLGLMIGTIYLSSAFKRLALPLIVAGLAGSVMALLLIILAPGNSVRRAYFPPSPDLLTTIGTSVSGAFEFITASLSGTIGLALIFSIWTFYFYLRAAYKASSYLGLKRFIQSLVILSLSGFILITSAFAPASYAMSISPPSRALVIPTFILVCIVVGYGSLIGFAFVRVRSVREMNDRALHLFGFVVMFVLLILGPIASTRDVFALAPVANDLANIWDKRDQAIRAANLQGVSELEVPVLPYSGGLEDIGPDPNHWLNRCVAEYYQLDSIVAR
jgi:hypothetical protein